MDISKLKNLVKQNGDKFILVENGEPEIVLMSFHEYQRLTGGDTDNNAPLRDRHPVFGNNASYAGETQVSPLETEFVAPFAEESQGLPVRLEDIGLDDLPI